MFLLFNSVTFPILFVLNCCDLCAACFGGHFRLLFVWVLFIVLCGVRCFLVGWLFAMLLVVFG